MKLSRLSELLTFQQSFGEQEQHIRYKVVFLNSVFLLAVVVAFGMGFYRWQHSALMGAIDFAFSIGGLLALAYLRRHKEKVELVSTVAIAMAYLLFLAIYLLAPYNTMRLSLFFLLSASVFYLKGRRTGLYGLACILLTIPVAHVLAGGATAYSTIDIITTCVYLIALFVIFWQYESVRELQYQRDHEHEMQLRVDQRTRQLLEAERGRFQTILDNAPLGIWMLTPEGRLQFVNKGFCKATGITEETFLAARHYVEVLPASMAANCMQSDRECLAQNAPHLSREWVPFVDGRDHLLEITKIRLKNPDGYVSGLIGLAMDITERAEHEKQLEKIAHFDALTGVPNRVLLADRLKQAVARTHRDQGMLAVCYLDLDGFKPVNDSYGHEIGDQVLVEITRRIKQVIREDDTVARLGGDEFVVLLVGLTRPEECAGSLHRLLHAISQPISIQQHSIQISASIGVSLYPEDEHDPDTLLRHADQAMYIAKQAGRNQYHLFDPGHDQRARSHHAMQEQIRRGMDRGEFELYFQPKISLSTGELLGAEALIRWNHPERGLLLPGEFLRVIENTELEIVLGDWVIADAIGRLRRWREQGFAIEVSINVSAWHLQSPGFVDSLRTAANLCCPGDCSGTLQVEVLETAALNDVATVSGIIQECKLFGMCFALDDFGTGYSSLSYLSKFDVDTLKIDQSFVRDMLHDKGDHAIVQGIIALAKAFEMTTVAEGVETDEQYRMLAEMGCDLAQGFGIARPMPEAALLEWGRPRLPKQA
ncbi:MAG: EAL domain-containing protein [Sideroxydans sp.]|nr:EAL domain-containing protein [Sideroxydans sp.]